MPISPSRITSDYVMELNTENFLSLADPSKVLEQAQAAAEDNPYQDIYDAIGANSNGDIDLLDPNGPLGKLGKSIFNERSLVDDVLGLFDNVICKGEKYTYDINLNLFLKDLIRDLKFNFNPTLCGYSLKNDPIGVLTKIASNFNPFGINININGDTKLVDKLKKTLDKVLGKSNLPSSIKNAILIKTDNKLPGLRSPVGTSIGIKKEFNDSIGIGNRRNNIDYDFTPFLITENYKQAFDIVAQKLPNNYGTYVWDAFKLGTEENKRLFMDAYSKSLMDKNGNNTVLKLNTIKYVFDGINGVKPTVIDTTNFISRTDKILDAMKTDKTTITKDKVYEWNKLTNTLDTVLPTWNKSGTDYNYSKLKGNNIVNDLAIAKTKSKAVDTSFMSTGVIEKELSMNEEINIVNAFN